VTTTLAQVLDLTDRVQAAMDAGDWLAAQDLETQRRAALERLVAEQGTGGDMVGALTQLHERNQRMIGEVHHHRRRVLRDAALVKTGQSAASAYGGSHAKTG
jgi:hypothetical protein